MKKQDKIEKYKPQNFNYEDDLTPGFWFGVILSIITMLAIIILFSIFVAGGFIYAIGAK